MELNRKPISDKIIPLITIDPIVKAWVRQWQQDDTSYVEMLEGLVVALSSARQKISADFINYIERGRHGQCT